eukprot:COSAG06_NODE_36459_length_447_cov_0.698276_1_plen_22_part_10
MNVAIAAMIAGRLTAVGAGGEI